MNQLAPSIPLTPDLAHAWQWLLQAAYALAAVASAALGRPAGFSPVTAPPALALSSPFSDLTVTEAIDEFLLAKARAGRSDRYLRALRNSLQQFRAGRAHKPLASVTPQEIEA